MVQFTLMHPPFNGSIYTHASTRPSLGGTG